ncbi:MAG: VWA domain-containing protein [Opitutae bacterium]|nr:VWA domain-containing protein [Opitutae bacterium]
MGDLVLHDPLWLLALLVLPLIGWLRQRRRVRVLVVPFAAAWHRPSLAGFSRWPLGLAVTGLVLLIGALARPQRVEDKREVRSEGYDLILAIDLSGSMLSVDAPRPDAAPNRLQVIKPVIEAFISKRPNDRIGVVLFGEQAFTLAPLTLDHPWLARQIGRLSIGLVGPNRTAIGDGLGVALTRLEQSRHTEGNKRKGAFVILLTDGSNNAGALDPLQAAALAKSRNIPVYTIGAGQAGYSWAPQFDDRNRVVRYHQRPSDLDEGVLRNISSQTNGQFFRAHDTTTVTAAFAAIDQAKKIEFQAKSHLVTTELFMWLAAPGAVLTLLGALAALLRRESRRAPAAPSIAAAAAAFQPTRPATR